jgi:hypothetical protein
MLLIIILPFLGVLIYLIIRGHRMHERTVDATRSQDEAFRAYVRTAASTHAPAAARLTTWQSSRTSRIVA